MIRQKFIKNIIMYNQNEKNNNDSQFKKVFEKMIFSIRKLLYTDIYRYILLFRNSLDINKKIILS